MSGRRRLRRRSVRFSSRHYSLLSIVSLAMGICSFAGMIIAFFVASSQKGKPPVHIGGVGLFAVLGDFVGIAAAMVSLTEQDIFKWVSYLGLIFNMLNCVLWVLVIFIGTIG